MSRVLLIATDKPLSLYSCREMRTKTVAVEGTLHTISFLCGLQVSEHSYYRSCVDGFNYPMKPCQYELDLDSNETDLTHLKEYLSNHLCPGEQTELWGLCISDLPNRATLRTHTRLSHLDTHMLKQLLTADDLCITVTID